MNGHDVWPYVIAAYAVTGGGLVALIAFVLIDLRRWAARARREDKA